jgi:hypothetical protein
VELSEEMSAVKVAHCDHAVWRDRNLDVVAVTELGDHEPMVDELAPDCFLGSFAPTPSFAVAAGLVVWCGHGCEARRLMTISVQ